MDIKSLSSEQKLKLVMAVNNWSNYDIEGKIYQFKVSDGPVGLRTFVDTDDESKGMKNNIAYPSEQMLANTWSTELAEKYGGAIANDCIENGIDVILGPGVNIKRIPTCGRNFEYFSEDPVVAGYMARGYIDGLQKRHVGACIKHYCCNNAEFARLYASSNVDERTLREIYLKQFEIAMKSQPWAVMCSYNLVNGTLMAENKKLFDVLRNELGFKGLVMSDWCAVRRTSKAINNELDIEMPYHEGRAVQLREDYAAGLVDEEALNRAAEKVIEFATMCGCENEQRKLDMTPEQRMEVAANVEREGIVLLKNKNNALPLTNESILVTGAPERMLYAGGGSAKVPSGKKYVRLGAALREHGFSTSYRETVRYVAGGVACMSGSDPSCLTELMGRDAAIIEVGNPESVEGECCDRQTIKLCREEEETIKYLSNRGKKVIVVVYAGAAIDMSAWIDDVDAVVWAGFGGDCVNEVVAEVLCGKTNPSGKLTETFPLCLEDVKAMHSYRDIENFNYEEELDVGYRYFTKHNIPVLFPFGYGLSYSSFEYKNLVVTAEGNKLVAEFDIENTSDIDGKEVAQLYISPETSEDRPTLELKGFTKVLVKAHETVRARIEVDSSLLTYFSLEQNKTVSFESFKVKIGKNANEIVLEN